MRSVTCKNNKGSSITFGETGFTPFLLAHIDGIYDSDNKLSITENALLSGGDYHGSRIPTRNIVLTITDKPNTKYNQAHRDLLRSIFVEGLKGTLIYKEDDSERCIDYYVEYVHQGKHQLFNISLLCPDPYFYDIAYTNVDMASWMSDFEFPHEFLAAGEELSHKEEAKIANIVGVSQTPVGMIIKIEANGEITNPSVVKITTGEHIKLGTQSNPFQMQFGDVLEIVTEGGKRNTTLTRGWTTSSVNQYLTEDSKFFQITYGLNQIGCGADAGVDNMLLDIRYRNRYEGV